MDSFGFYDSRSSRSILHDPGETHSIDLEYTGDRTHSAIAFIKGDMTKNMNLFFPHVHDEIKNCVSQEIKDCSGAYKTPCRKQIK